MELFEYAEVVDSGKNPGARFRPATPAIRSGLSEAGLSAEQLQARFLDLFPSLSDRSAAARNSGNISGAKSRKGEPELPGRPASQHSRDDNGDVAAQLPSFNPRNPYFDVSSIAVENSQTRPGGDQPRGLSSLTEQELADSLAQQCQMAQERGRKEGFALGLTSGRSEAESQFAGERGRLQIEAVRLAESFEDERESYFGQAERETVRLALAIAARVLRREAQSDPLLLTNAVRVALGQLAASTQVRIHVPAVDSALWEQGLGLIPGVAGRAEVVADHAMIAGQCRMEADLGTVDLGILSQLQVIERSFDLPPSRNMDRKANAGANWGRSEDSDEETYEVPLNRQDGQ